MKHLFIGLFAWVSLLATTSGQTRELGVTFTHKFNGNDLIIGESTFPIWNGKMVWIKRAELYLSGIKVADEAGNVTLMPDTYLLLRAQDVARRMVLGNIPSTPISRLYMSIGVDTTKNHDDPTLYPETHPLGLKDPSMHWGWAGGYRFLVVEGMVDHSGDGVPETPFEYHNLGDELYKQTEIIIPALYDDGGNITLPIILDYARLFDNNTMLGNQIVHGSSAKNVAMMNNAVKNDFFSLATLVNTPELEESPWSVLSQNGQLHIAAEAWPAAKITVSDISGRVCVNSVCDASGSASVPVNSLSAGIWVVTLQSGQNSSSKKVMIQH